jgi:hypothetical protein
MTNDGLQKTIKDFFGDEDGKICVYIPFYDGNILVRRKSKNDEIEIFNYEGKNINYIYDEYVEGYDVMTNNINILYQCTNNYKKTFCNCDDGKVENMKKKLKCLLDSKDKKSINNKESYCDMMRLRLQMNMKDMREIYEEQCEKK